MILGLFTYLTHALYSSAHVALGAALIWGILSVILSPCHLSSIPLIIGFVNDQGQTSTKKAFIFSTLFSAGIWMSIVIIGLITATMGRMLGDIGQWANYLVAGIFFLVGLYLLDVLKFPFIPQLGQPSFQKKGLFAALILGLVFGIALGPCTFAYMIPVLGIALSKASVSLWFSIMLVSAYAIGHCAVIVVAGTSFELVQRYLNWNEKSNGTLMLRRICGTLIIFGGIYLLFK
ncbi:MAG: cytochrome C biogenesis protein [Candidatus Margulisiibacteriota bacterium]|nr:MAG: cytochrome C biogenesis protein [Candidatus Margulisbacteria bacterium GWD2_39_127]OGI02359.1 MAG: cytochrome C biogenesis protein [Candidatus Margulisbacteria bacterium GWF2_38_17]OGI08492.1 MAG: cytochrome C biogenesis protein [Candidatus Margulisbacteria bacterium GWE2_39_32]PZM79004.1 MAG: cytochrome C biogenesis protein [Candidatus Margulisiibacteriota bacterium]HAR64218.1 cytochrome C biogenesis protein [Candidatus Margulisiibacteriota bacterium]